MTWKKKEELRCSNILMHNIKGTRRRRCEWCKRKVEEIIKEEREKIQIDIEDKRRLKFQIIPIILIAYIFLPIVLIAQVAVLIKRGIKKPFLVRKKEIMEDEKNKIDGEYNEFAYLWLRMDE